MEKQDRSNLWVAATSVTIAALIGVLLGILQSFASEAMEKLGYLSSALVVGGCLFVGFLLSAFAPTGTSQSKFVRVAIILALLAGYILVRSTFGPGGWHKP